VTAFRPSGGSAALFRNGELVLLDEQDRSLWDQQQIHEG
jgi:predicted RNA polymerase sigma factor